MGYVGFARTGEGRHDGFSAEAFAVFNGPGPPERNTPPGVISIPAPKPVSDASTALRGESDLMSGSFPGPPETSAMTNI